MVAAGVPIRTPEATVGGRSSKGTVPVRGDTDLGESLLGGLSRPPRRTKVDEEEMRVGPAGQHVQPTLLERLGQRVRIRAHLLLVLPERLGRSDLETGRLRSDHVVQRPSLHPREHRAVEGPRVLFLAEHETGPRPGERLVRGRGDEVAVGNRVGMDPRGDEPREVRHVAEQIGTDLVRDLAEPMRLYRPRVRRAAAHDQLRPVLLREAKHVVVVDDVGLARHAVVRDRVQAAGEVDLETVREMPAVRKLEREDRLSGLEAREVHGHVRLRTCMRLHVRVLCAEEGQRTVDREPLDLVDHLAAAVVATARVPL
jgi:hypothetical protein